MVYYGRTDISEDVYVNKTSVSKECIICHYWHYLYKKFKLQPDVWSNGCHDILMKHMDLKVVAIFNICGVVCSCII